MMREDKEEKKAWNYALRLLNYRERSRQEVFERLKARRYSSRIINSVLRKLERIDLINDEKFARLWVSSRMRFRPRSAWLIASELRRKGVDKDLVRRVIEEEIPSDQELATALSLARSRAVYYRSDHPTKVKRKLFAYLTRRGFSLDLIQSVIEKVAGDEFPGD